MNDLPTFRLLKDPPLDGRNNMARDEALMFHVGQGDSPPTLRLYQWISPMISLGYFQRYTDLQALPQPTRSLPVVRRPTGGGAILHDLELTYSLSIPVDHPAVAGSGNRLYELAHDALILSLEDLHVVANRGGETDDSGPSRGPFFCFARRHRFDVLRGADKIAGSAQRRTRKAILQHGSIVLHNRYPVQPTAGVPMPYADAVARLRASFPEHLADLMGVNFEPAPMHAAEKETATALIYKYAGDEWTCRR